MRSDSVVLPESMWAEMPMFRMKSMFVFATSAFLKAPRKGALQLPRFERKNQAFGGSNAVRQAVPGMFVPGIDASALLSLRNNARNGGNPAQDGRAGEHPARSGSMLPEG